MSINRQMDKDVEYYSATKKNKNLPLTTMWMGLKDIRYNEMSDRGRQILYIFHLYVESKK